MSIRPPIINQLTLNDPGARSDCGEVATSMILQAFGITDSPLEEIQDLGHDSFTVFPELVKLFTDNNLVVTAIAGAAMADGLSGADALVLIHDNNNADPDPAGAYEHFIVAYRLNSNGTVQCANPWGGRDIAYSRSVLASATIQAALVRLPAAPEVIMAGGSFRPGTHEYSWVVINADKSITHWWTDLDDQTKGGHDDLGPLAGGPASCVWSSDGQVFVVEVIGSDGTTIDRNVWRGGKFGGWGSSNTTTLQLGVVGPAAPAVLAPFTATITPK